MANLVPRSVVKSAVRTLTAPIADLTAFSEVVDDSLTNNPFDCTAYESGGVAMPAVEKTRESYTAGSRTRTARRSRSPPRRSNARRSRPTTAS